MQITKVEQMKMFDEITNVDNEKMRNVDKATKKYADIKCCYNLLRRIY